MGARDWVLLLLAVPFLAVLWPPLYATAQPEWQGVPFFIWYQFAWTVLTALLTIVVYRVRSAGEPS